MNAPVELLLLYRIYYDILTMYTVLFMHSTVIINAIIIIMVLIYVSTVHTLVHIVF